MAPSLLHQARDHALAADSRRATAARLERRAEARKRERRRRLTGLGYTALIALAGLMITQRADDVGGTAPAIVLGGLVAAISLFAALVIRRAWVLMLPCAPFLGIAVYGYLSVSIRCGGCMPNYSNGLWAIDLVLVFLSEIVALVVGLALGGLPWSRPAQHRVERPARTAPPRPLRLPAPR